MRYRLTALIVLLVAAGVIATGTTAGASGKGEGAGSVEARVREVNKLQRYLYLEDGTMLLALDPRVLDQVTPGVRIRAGYEERAGQKLINRLDIIQ